MLFQNLLGINMENKMIYRGIGIIPGLVTSQIYMANSPNISDLDLEGKILLIKNATPEIVIYFNKILGLVTEYGGITCHAAILAREFGLPCIVSAKGLFDHNIDRKNAVLNSSDGTLEVYL